MHEKDKGPSLYDRLLSYAGTDACPFHMPGHKRQGFGFEDPFLWDITEIDGFDDLHHAQGILKEAMEQAASLYGSDETYFLVNGSTCGILAAVSAAAAGAGLAAGGRKPAAGRVLMARNCHKSVYHAVLLNGLAADYLYPDYLEPFACFGGVKPEQVEEGLRRHPDTCMVVLPSPTYEGIVSDIREIARIAHRYGALLIVDEAHGAHFPFHAAFPASALNLGADIVIQSLHKTLPSLTQTALLHVKGGRVDLEKLRLYLNIYETSSPSYVLMASIDACIRHMASPQGRQAMNAYVSRLTALRAELGGLDRLKLLQPDEEGGPQAGIYAADMGKLVISTARAAITGPQLYDLLRTRCHIQPEMHTVSTVVCMTSVNDTQESYERLLAALKEIDQTVAGKNKQAAMNLTGPEKGQPAANMVDAVSGQLPAAIPVRTIAEALNGPSVPLPLAECAGRVSAAFVYLYPPGIPLLAPGEQVTAACLERVALWRRLGLEVHGLKDGALLPVIPDNQP